MGLEEFSSDDSGTSSSPRTKSTSDEPKVEVAHGSRTKSFGKDKWERMESIIESDFGESVNEVMNNWSSKDRFEILDKASKLDYRRRNQPEKEEKEPEPDFSTCPACGAKLLDYGVEIAGHKFCSHHPAARVARELDNIDK